MKSINIRDKILGIFLSIVVATFLCNFTFGQTTLTIGDPITQWGDNNEYALYYQGMCSSNRIVLYESESKTYFVVSKESTQPYFVFVFKGIRYTITANIKNNKIVVQ